MLGFYGNMTFVGCTKKKNCISPYFFVLVEIEVNKFHEILHEHKGS